MVFAVDFDHLSLQIGNIEPKQDQWRAVEALLLGKYVMAVLPLVSARPLLMRALPSLKRIRVTEIKRHRPCYNRSSSQLHRRPVSVEQLSIGSCLWEEGNLLKEMRLNKYWVIISAEWALSSDFRFMIDESSVLSKNLSLTVVDERHTVETCQNTPKFNLTIVLQIRQKFNASLCLAFLPPFYRVSFECCLLNSK